MTTSYTPLHVDYRVHHSMRTFYGMYLRGPDGPSLLRAIHAIWDGHADQARGILRSDPFIIANRTRQPRPLEEGGQSGSKVGSNALADLIENKLFV
jgi:hypothetical protein